ncbi:MAG: hypothetical protein AAGG51_04415 [Cyanobacteria bacterium P01_G01_bin.54]
MQISQYPFLVRLINEINTLLKRVSTPTGATSKAPAGHVCWGLARKLLITRRLDFEYLELLQTASLI